MSENGSLEATRREQELYDRKSRFYDLMDWPLDAMGMGRLRRRLWEQAKGKRVLEVGVGTGRNVPHYPPESSVVAVDLSPGMLRRGGKRGGRGGGPGGFGLCA